MKNRIPILLCFLCLLLLCACGKNKTPEPRPAWDCSVTCAEESTEEHYVITYSDEEIISATGALTFTNVNDFEITIHLLTEGQEERSDTLGPRGICTLFQLQRDVPYQIGIHADVEPDTPIYLTVHDGAGNFPPLSPRTS